jgi:hypothetical protein
MGGILRHCLNDGSLEGRTYLYICNIFRKSASASNHLKMSHATAVVGALRAPPRREDETFEVILMHTVISQSKYCETLLVHVFKISTSPVPQRAII